MFKFIEKLLGFGNSEEIANLIENGAVIVDVRSPFEYKRAHMEGSVNIPLDTIDSQIKLLKIKKRPVITCCRSGHRSGIAEKTLRARGINAINGGSWGKVQKIARRVANNKNLITK